MNDPNDYLRNKFVDTISEFRGTAVEVSYFTDGTTSVKLEDVTDDSGARRIEWFTSDRLVSETRYDGTPSDVGFSKTDV